MRPQASAACCKHSFDSLPKGTEKVLRHGWCHTGDLACSDQHEYIKITRRIKELIIRGGENIAPVEVEEVVAQHPAVLDRAVVGAPHEELGEVPVVFVVPEDQASFEPDDYLDYCAKHLARYKVPAEVMVTDAIPRTGSGKRMRFKLREQLLH
jgi:long-chain acyl-CoA synthetase